jgi:hypothetical protein
MTAQRYATRVERYLGYDPAVSAVRLAAEVAHAHLSRDRQRPMRIGLHHRKEIPYVHVYPYELPMFVLERARAKRIDLSE